MKLFTLFLLAFAITAQAQQPDPLFCQDVNKCLKPAKKHKKYNLTPVYTSSAAGTGAAAGATASASANASARSNVRIEQVIVYRDAPTNTVGIFGLVPTAKAQTVTTTTSSNAAAGANATAANCSPPASSSDSNSGAAATTSTTTNQLNNPALGLMYEHRFGAISGMVGATLQSSPTVLVGVGFNF